MKKKYDVIIVGNGALGMVAAYFLKKREKNLKVCLIGDPERKGCATLAASAMINVWSELSNNLFNNPFLAERFSLTRKGGDLWDVFGEELSEVSGKNARVQRGTYLMTTTHSTEIEFKAFRYIKKMLAENNIDHKEIDPSSLPWLKPSQGSGPVEVLWNTDGRLDSREVIGALSDAMTKVGVETYHAKAEKVEKKSSLFKKNGFEVSLGNGDKILGEQVVLANGAYAQKLIDQLPALRKEMPRLLFGIGAGIDVTFPNWVLKYGGIGKEIFDLDAVVRTTDRGGACGVHVAPYSQRGSFYLGASSLISTDDDILPNLHGIHSMIHSAVHEINRNFFYAGIQPRLNGFRPTTIDAFPLLGETTIEGLWVINGTKRDGLTMSPFISNEIAKGILGEKMDLPESFRPCRKLISYKTQKEAIKDTELMYMGADFQHGGMQAPYGVESYVEFKKQSIESIYKKRKVKGFGIHPEVIHLYENDDFYNLIKHPMEKAS